MGVNCTCRPTGSALATWISNAPEHTARARGSRTRTEPPSGIGNGRPRPDRFGDYERGVWIEFGHGPETARTIAAGSALGKPSRWVCGDPGIGPRTLRKWPEAGGT